MSGDAAALAAVPCGHGKRLHFTWGLGSEILLCNVNSPGHTEASPESTTATLLSWGFPGQLRRRVIFDTLPKYQQLRLSGAGADSGTKGAAQSPEARHHTLQEYSNTLGEVLALASASGGDGDEDDEAAVIAAEHVVWQMLQIFFLGAARVVSSIAQDLAYWLYGNASVLCDGFTPQSAVEQFEGSTVPEAEPTYWSTLQRCVALGWLCTAGRLLGLHTAWQRAQLGGFGSDADLTAQLAVLEALMILLRRMPVLVPQGGGVAGRKLSELVAGMADDAVPTYLDKRDRWLATCRQLLADKDAWAACQQASPSTAQGCRAIVEVLVGTPGTLQAITASWLELLLAQVLHRYPTIKPQVELSTLLQQCQQEKPITPGSPLEPVLIPMSRLLPLAADADVQRLVSECSNMFGDWFMAHSVHMLVSGSSVARSLLSAPLAHTGGEQSEFYLLDYVATLMPVLSCWQVAAHYLAWCPVHGRAALLALLDKLPVGSRDQRHMALAATAVAKRYKLTRRAKEIQHIAAVALWQRGQIAAAVSTLLGTSNAQHSAFLVLLGQLLTAVKEGLGNAKLAVGIEEQIMALAPLLRMSLPPATGEPGTGLQPDGVLRAGPEYTARFLCNLAGLLKARRTLQEAVEAGQPRLQVESAMLAVKTELVKVVCGGLPDQTLLLPLVFMAVPLMEANASMLSSLETQALLNGLHIDTSWQGNSMAQTAGQPMQHAVQMALMRNLARGCF